MRDDFETEVDRNFDVFAANLRALLPEHRGKFVLLRDGEMLSFHESEAAALADGRGQFPDGLFSVQEVTDRPVDLGFFSHAINSRLA
jgi:hypothetical protein